MKRGELVKDTVDIAGETRKYLYYIPVSLKDNSAAPMLLSFHGAGSDAAYHTRLTSFHKLAETEQFIVVYPESKQVNADPLSKQWNDGREGNPAYEAGVNDVQFVEELISQWKTSFHIDANKVYATGFSNGSSFSLKLALEMPGAFAAVGAVGATLPALYQNKQADELPPLLFIMGNDDPIVPFSEADGNGEHTYAIDGLLGAKATVEWWVNQTSTSWKVTKERLDPLTLHDPTRVEENIYTTNEGKIAAALYIVKGGGHTWPGGPKVQSPGFGKVCSQITASKVIFGFFQSSFTK
ncbi:alpha/beta hydrolase family esterase [Salibacterium salarium]|nr:PHB depolymerase family esterase [Salibacterium salarium]